jgi:hypothetical protein
LDPALAELIETFRPWIIEGNIPLIDPIGSDRYADFITLAGIGFLHMAGHAFVSDGGKVRDDERVEFELQSGVVSIGIEPGFSVGTVKFEKKSPFQLLLSLRRELNYSVLDTVDQHPGLPKALIAHLAK